MAKKMKAITLVSILMTFLCAVLYGYTKNELVFTLLITFGTISYHFVMRLFVGLVIDRLLDNHVDYRRRWFQVSDAEQKLYKSLKVKQWKGKMATYDSSCFDNRIHSWDEIAQAMCQAEVVHEVNVVIKTTWIISRHFAFPLLHF